MIVRSMVRAVVFMVAGCTFGSFQKGSIVTKQDLSTGSKATFRVSSCVKTTDNTQVDGQTFEYSLIEHEGRPALFEKWAGEGDISNAIITNSWRDTDGTHYFEWVTSIGWEFVIPDSGNGVRRLYKGGTYRAEDGSARPTKKPPLMVCELIRAS